jgi:DNA-binding NarL/FixJ family response regulator
MTLGASYSTKAIFAAADPGRTRGSSRVTTVKTLDRLQSDYAGQVAAMCLTSELMAQRLIRVLIAEDHAIVREGTRQVLERDPMIETVGEAEDGRQAVSLAAELQPDVVLLDLRLPHISGIEAIGLIKKSSPASRILILSAYDEDDYVFAALEAGAGGYLLKTAHASEVIDAIHAVSRGDIVLHPAIAAKLVRARTSGTRYEESVESLSERENEILRLAARGLHNKEIARQLSLSTRTVEGHLSHLFAKLGVSSRTEAIIFALSHHWLSVD